LSFGSELTWLYAYLTCDDKTVRSAKLNVSLTDRHEVLTDDRFPFEFSLPLKSTNTTAQLSFEAQAVSGQAIKSKMIQIGKVKPQ